MKKFTVKVLALMLAMALVVCSGVQVFAASTGKVKHYDVYTCLGDSNAAGFSTSGYLYSPLPSATAYHTLVAEAVGAELRQYGFGAFRTQDVLYMLDPEYEMDWTYSFYAGSDIHKEHLDNYKAEYVQAVKDADLLTLQIGINDLSMGISPILAIVDNPIEAFEPIKAKFASNTTALQIISLLEMAVRLVKVSVALNTYGKQTTDAFGARFDRILKSIYRLNPDVDVVVIGLANPMDDVYLAPEVNVNVGKIYAIAITQMNNYIKYKSAYRDQFMYCDVSGIDYPTGYLSYLPNDAEYQFYVIHLLDAGAAEVANRIINLLPRE